MPAPHAVVPLVQGEARTPAVGQRPRACGRLGAAHLLGDGGRQQVRAADQRVAERGQIQGAREQRTGRRLQRRQVLPGRTGLPGRGVERVSGGDGTRGRGIPDERRYDTEGFEEQHPHRLGPRHAGDRLHQPPGGDVAGVGVGEVGARREQRVAGGADGREIAGGGGRGGGVRVRPGGQSAGVTEQVTYRHVGYAAQFGEVRGGGLVRVEVAVVGEEHDERGGAGLGERSHRDRRVRGERSAGRGVGRTGVYGDDVRAGVEGELGPGHPVGAGQGVEKVLQLPV
ncbi:hypothetical protein EASAB2608_00753 [Streptomyces sp. EAS-AB2608]|nr:hypothetical protein EASAB2608_00753 [Streptomyces sp. EAS-AB2608]